MSARIGWVVDVQNDFMLPDGRLYVRDLFDRRDLGAIRIHHRIEAAVAWMRGHCDAIVYTGDGKSSKAGMSPPKQFDVKVVRAGEANGMASPVTAPAPVAAPPTETSGVTADSLI